MIGWKKNRGRRRDLARQDGAHWKAGVRRMTQVLEEKNVHLSNFDRIVAREGAASRPWLDKLRRGAIARFDLVGFPSRREEAWRFTNIDPIVKTPFRLGDLDGADHAASAAAKYSFGAEAAVELVFVNGQYVSRLSKHGKLPR